MPGKILRPSWISACLSLARFGRTSTWIDTGASAVDPDLEERFLALDGGRATFSREELPLGAIYILGHRSAEEGAPSIKPMSAREALLDLVKNTYMNWLLDREQRAVEFEFLAKLVQQVPVRRLIPHADPKKISDLCNLLVEDAQSLIAN